MRIGIIGAMNEEVEKYIALLNLKKDSFSKRDVYIGKLEDKNVYVMKCGIGKVNSASATQFLIDSYHPDLIINSGCAGSLVKELKIMDVAISSYVTYHDFNPIRIMEGAVPSHGQVYADHHLIEIARSLLEQKEEISYFVVPFCSGDCFITSARQRDEIALATGAKVVDMESASIGHVAALNQVPFVSIRTISDFSDGMEDFEELASYQSSHLVLEMIKLL